MLPVQVFKDIHFPAGKAGLDTIVGCAQVPGVDMEVIIESNAGILH